MLHKWKEETLSLLKTDASLGKYRDVLVRMKAEGISAADAPEHNRV